MSAQACTQLKFLHRLDIQKIYNHAKNKLCTRVRWVILKPIFVRKIGEFSKNRLSRVGFGALKVGETASIWVILCLMDSLMSFISFD